MRRKADDYVAFPYGFYGNYDFDLYDYRSINETRNPRTIEALIRGSVITGPVKHELAFGASQYRNTISNPDYVFNFSGVSNYFVPVIVPPAPEPLTPAVSYRQRETGVYGQDTWRLSSRVTLNDSVALLKPSIPPPPSKSELKPTWSRPISLTA